jgi:uncharacterized protein (TIGR02246 family)
MRACIFLTSVTLVSCLACRPSRGEEPTGQEAGATAVAAEATSVAAEAEIRSAAADFAAAFGRGDATAVAAHWIADGDYVDEFGQRYDGRAAIQQEYKTFFEQNPGAALHLTVDCVRLLGPDTAIEDGRAVIGWQSRSLPVFSRYTAVHVRQDGRWLMASVRDARQEMPSREADLTDLGWLIGQWRAEHEGAQLDVTYRWIVDRRVIERSHRVTKGGREISSGSQIIGWDPISQRIESWIFSSGGGYAVGAWSARDTGWSVETVGATREGVPTATTNTLTRVSDDTMSWTSSGRWIGDLGLSATNEVLLTRK